MEVEEPSHAYQKKLYSIGEYPEMENTALEKHEYYKGEILAMSGAGYRHNIISVNIIVSLERIQQNKRRNIFGSS